MCSDLKAKRLICSQCLFTIQTALIIYWEHLNNIRTKCGTDVQKIRWVDEGFDADTQLPVSPPLCTLKRRQAGGSEVDGFTKGGGQVCFSEGLRHRLDEEGKESGEKGWSSRFQSSCVLIFQVFTDVLLHIMNVCVLQKDIQDGRGRLWRCPHRKRRTPWPKQLHWSSLRRPADQ